MEILIGTQNIGKFKEIENILATLPVKIYNLNDYKEVPEIDENGSSFLDNAMIKAKALYSCFKIPVLVDDSGLVVKSLDGRPGIHSARYGGGGLTFSQKIDLLLDEMKDIKDRKAHFECTMIIYINESKYYVESHQCHGVITESPMGSEGFGFDPIFFVPECNKTMAELTLDEKNIYSHRGKATNAIYNIIKNLKV